MLNSVVQVTVNTGQSFTLVLHSPWTMFSKRLIEPRCRNSGNSTLSHLDYFLEYLSCFLYYSYITNHYTADSIVLTFSKFKITLNYFYLFLFMHCLNFLSFMFILDISNPLILIVIRRRLKVLHECVRIGE